MIKNIMMRNVASYNGDGVSIEELAKINFIYGGNGTGKTTISNFLANQDEGMFADCNCDWENDNHERIVVYNKNFREANIVNVQEISGIFTLGEESIELSREIDDIKKAIERLNQELLALTRQKGEKEEAIDNVDSSLREYMWSHIYKPHDNLKEAFRGFIKKDTFCNHILEVISQGLRGIVPIEELTAKYHTLFSEEGIQRIEPLKVDWFTNDLCEIETNSI